VIRFIADVMVGKLARRLRVLGFDVAYSNTYQDDEIITIAQGENRVILTRDTGISARRMHARCILIKSGAWREQVHQVIETFDLKDFKFLSRCLLCNVPLETADKETVFEKVPPYVYMTQERFARCPSCARVYWHGTHVDEMLKHIL
jgi:uncharacterized protein